MSVVVGAIAGGIPRCAGIGLRADHHEDLIRERPAVGWLEAHSENYFGDGGAQLDALLELRGHYPLSLHGVGLSIGSTDPWDAEHLRGLKRLVRRSEPALISEHLAWSSVAGRHFNDLLPLPFTEEALAHLVRRVGEVQDYLGRQILIENVSSYVQFADAQLSEWEFLNSLAQLAGCGILLDINNIYVNARNHGLDALAYIAAVSPQHVREIHLAGHSISRVEDVDVLIDTHSARVCDAVWALFATALRRFGRVPTLIEWDADLPPLQVLVDEAARAQSYLAQCDDLAA